MLILLLLLNFCRFYGFNEIHTDVEVDSDQALNSKAQVYKCRCTRRYTPGTCVDAVTSVWTYVFNVQNCTERLGCPVSYRANRFRSYGLCMRRCRPLVELYMQILAYEGQLLNSDQSQHIGARREDIFDLDLDLNSTQTETQEDEENEGKQYISLSQEDDTVSSVLYSENGYTVEKEDFFAPNIDYVIGGVTEENELLYED